MTKKPWAGGRRLSILAAPAAEPGPEVLTAHFWNFLGRFKAHSADDWAAQWLRSLLRLASEFSQGGYQLSWRSYRRIHTQQLNMGLHWRPASCLPYLLDC